MRLKEVESVLKSVDIENANLSGEYINNSSRRISNILQFKLFIENIEKMDIYSAEIAYFKNSELYQTTANELVVKNVLADKLQKEANYLINSCKGLKRVFQELLPESNPASINIKLPEPSDFEELIKTMSTFNKSISTIIVEEEIGGSVKINNWEHGSFWIELMLDTSAAVAVVSQVAWAAAVISKKYNENKLFAIAAKKMEIEQASLDDILDKQKIMTNALIETEAKAIEDKNFTKEDAERMGRLKHSIKTFAELISKGAEVHPSLMAPETVKNLFPDFKKLDTITSNVPQIEDKTKK